MHIREQLERLGAGFALAAPMVLRAAFSVPAGPTRVVLLAVFAIQTVCFALLLLSKSARVEGWA